MTVGALDYALVTPARDEAENLRRLAACVLAQTVRPEAWVIVENGSRDTTASVARALAAEHDWISVVELPEDTTTPRGGAIVRAFKAGVDALRHPPDVLVNLDADVSMEHDYFERLLAEFEARPDLGIASGSGYELEGGAWRQQFATRFTVWGATRAYRWACYLDVSPLEERLGWDGLDEIKANVRGWKTATLLDLPFLHHRRVGTRDGSGRAMWAAEGRLAHYMGYRLGYLAVRALYRSLRHREPSALALLAGYAAARMRREPRWDEPEARAYLRRTQRLRYLPVRAREALGRR